MSEVVGIGHALVDVVSHVDESFLTPHNLEKGGMMLADYRRISALLHAMPNQEEHSGGSVANTMAALGQMGSKALFIGKVGDDAHGKRFAMDMADAGVAFGHVAPCRRAHTGTSCIVVTPDAQRTMTTCLGAASRLSEKDLVVRDFAKARIVLLEAYLLDSPKGENLFARVAQLAKNAGASLALTLSDSACVVRHLDMLRTFVAQHVDILLGNADEFARLDAPRPPVWAMTMGAAGARARLDGQEALVAAEKAEALRDTTGAGDMFAAGFLSGILAEDDVKGCCLRGVRAAAQVISQTGARKRGK